MDRKTNLQGPGLNSLHAAEEWTSRVTQDLDCSFLGGRDGSVYLCDEITWHLINPMIKLMSERERD